MDHRRLKTCFLSLLLAQLILSCSTRSSDSTHSRALPLSVLEVSLSTERAFRLSEHFLEYEKGYQVRVRDLGRGLLVTDWTKEGFERHQITIRIAPQVEGSVISAHLRAEQIDAGRWKDLPSVGERESLFLRDLNQYLASRSESSKSSSIELK